ncbi:hypothetical protein WKW80_31285 [Variovorax humicola]|uniref:Uncharacterized protein n=1 Tax=Variovorax humicola TaxID=1769758 RepID=A0ABU8W8U1_9BURK
MALLRQCLRELRVKRREWSSSEDFWGDAVQCRNEDGSPLPATASSRSLPAQVLATDSGASRSSSDAP